MKALLLRPWASVVLVLWASLSAPAADSWFAAASEAVALLESFSGHVAVLPSPDLGSLSASPVIRALEEADAARHLVPLTPAQFVDTNFFNVTQYPVALYVGHESYFQTVHRAGDGDAALRHYLSAGGVLLVLPCGPFPLYYNQQRQPVNGAAVIGLNIGAGSFERPPAGLKLSFHAHTNQSVIRWPEAAFPFPAAHEADQRWRPSRRPASPDARCTPLLTLFDDRGGNHGDGAAWIEFTQGSLRGGRVLYVWFSVLALDKQRAAVLPDVLAWALAGRPAPAAKLVCQRTLRPPVIDGNLEDSHWRDAPSSPPFKLRGERIQPAAQRTTVQGRWDSQALYLAFRCARPPGAGSETNLDSVQIRLEPGRDGEAEAALTISVDNKLEFAVAAASQRPASTSIRHAARVNAQAWTAELALPWQWLRLDTSPPQLDDSLPAQFVRVTGRGGGAVPEAAVWSPANEADPTHHWGMLRFAADPLGDDFEARSEVAGGGADWRLEAGQWKLDHGTLLGQDCVADRVEIQGAARGSERWRDYAFSVRFKLESRGSDWRDGPWFGLRCRPDGDGYYLTFTDRDCQLHKVIYGVTTSDANPLARAAWKPDDRWHTLHVEARANRFEARIDDQPLLDVTDDAHLNLPSLRSGGIVLAARKSSAARGSTIVRYDDLDVQLFDK